MKKSARPRNRRTNDRSAPVAKRTQRVVAPDTDGTMPFAWVDQRRLQALTSADLENRVTLLGLVNKLTFSNMDTICEQMVSSMKDPHLLSEAVEVIFYQARNPAWMVLFVSLCGRLVQDSPVFGRHGEINFRRLLLDRYRVEFEETVLYQVPPLVQLCAKQVVASTSVPVPVRLSVSGTLTRTEAEALLPLELVAFLHEQPWIVTPKVLDERWRRANELIVLMGEFYNMKLIEEKQILWMLAQLCDSIEQGVRRNVEPLCRLLSTIGSRGHQRPQPRPSDADKDEDDDDDEEEEEEEEDMAEQHERKERLDEFMAKVASYRERTVEWNLGARIRFMLEDLLLLWASNWESGVNR